MANEGKRCYCRCIQDMRMQIGKEELTIFYQTRFMHVWFAQVTRRFLFIKIYGEEFSLSCSETEFKEYFRFVKYKSSDEKL